MSWFRGTRTVTDLVEGRHGRRIEALYCVPLLKALVGPATIDESYLYLDRWHGWFNVKGQTTVLVTDPKLIAWLESTWRSHVHSEPSDGLDPIAS